MDCLGLRDYGVWGWGLGVRFGGLRLRAHLGFGVWGWGFMDCGSWFMVEGLGSRVQVLRFRV